MSALMKWSRFRDLDDLPNRLSSFFGRPLLPAIGGEAFENAEWAPSCTSTWPKSPSRNPKRLR